MDTLQIVKLISTFLLIAGGLNWLSIALLNKNIVADLVGNDLAYYVYILVGLAAIIALYSKVMWISGGMPMRLK
jgi:uncharacterized membrane protein YuzA (DUF378 family)